MNALETRLSEKLEGVQLREAIARMAALPRYATEWERRIVAMGPDHAAIDAAIAQLRTMRDPKRCPEEWLFLLAWDLSVDVWQADWPENTKRRVCEASWIVHRYKGTRYAIEESLKALGMTVRLKRWFDFDPPRERGTFEATVYVNEQLYENQPEFLSERHQDDAYQAIWRSKPLTRHFSFKIGAGYKNATGVANAFATTEVMRCDVSAERDSGFDQPVGVGNSLAALAISRETVEAGRDHHLKSSLGVASSISALEFMRVTFAS